MLIVDDEESIRFALSRYLRSRGFEVIMAESGAAALARLGEEQFDIMLCDVRMPVMSGLEVLPHALRLDADLGIVMLTAVNDAAPPPAAPALGATAHLPHPLQPRAADRAGGRRARASRRGPVKPLQMERCRGRPLPPDWSEP